MSNTSFWRQSTRLLLVWYGASWKSVLYGPNSILFKLLRLHTMSESIYLKHILDRRTKEGERKQVNGFQAIRRCVGEPVAQSDSNPFNGFSKTMSLWATGTPTHRRIVRKPLTRLRTPFSSFSTPLFLFFACQLSMIKLNCYLTHKGPFSMNTGAGRFLNTINKPASMGTITEEPAESKF